ncbi:hypothetical protein LR48_Vigan03g166400 [Vigna angularis]|uniref:Uncharacterized protein n=1 Tax=Phaseolus angularis TaxID=3914 RepID=A0A0L9U6I8_PHAAN|nr:hypothetical protein LR48_Vigan03g166400 [Vigna angularis]
MGDEEEVILDEQHAYVVEEYANVDEEDGYVGEEDGYLDEEDDAVDEEDAYVGGVEGNVESIRCPNGLPRGREECWGRRCREGGAFGRTSASIGRSSRRTSTRQTSIAGPSASTSQGPITLGRGVATHAGVASSSQGPRTSRRGAGIDAWAASTSQPGGAASMREGGRRTSTRLGGQILGSQASSN